MAGLALSSAFLYSCSHGSSGSGSDDSDNSNGNSNALLSRANWSCTTSETETVLGNKVSDVLCLSDSDKTFELHKNISYDAENISFYQLFYKGTYSGSIRDGMKFSIAEELDISSFDEEMMQIFGLSDAEARNITAQEARAVSPGLAAKLSDCKEKLKNIKLKNVSSEKKTMSTKFDANKFLLQDTNGAVHEITEKITDGYINLDGFVFTGNPCNTRKDKNAEDSEYYWPGTEAEGAIALKKIADGKYTCTFRMDRCWEGDDAKDTLIRLVKNNWEIDWGLSAIDKGNSILPAGAYITDDTKAVNNTPENEKYQNPRNIAIAGLEAKRKYDITFDTKKSPGKICIELKRHEIYSLDGWLFTGTPVKMDKTYENGGDWPANEADGALPLKKNGNSWIVENVTLKEGWNGFKLCTPEWTDEIGWSQVAYSEDNIHYYQGNSDIGDYYAGGFGYALDDDDVIAFTNSNTNSNFDIWKGTETGTLTFTIVNGLIQIESNIDEPN
ncbi:MAG: hypothetical protein J6K96_02100 [Treponema sp.]|nr:hypothetical protein [Treponema sp.]